MIGIRKTNNGYSLIRNGSPYFVKGACIWGENAKLLELKRAGANSVRTYSSQYAAWTLNAAQELGLTVMLGYEINSVNWGGTDYLDEYQVELQREKFKKFILQYKDHPALLLYAIGNEVEHSAENTPQWEAMWRELNYLAKMAHFLDSNHPAAIVLAGPHKSKLDAIKQYCPEIELVCINTYSGARTLQKHFKENNWNKPYLVTEFGWRGWWETDTFEKVPLEITSTQKAKEFELDYTTIANDKNCLGSYIFFWYPKVEGTATWFGMFLASGEKLETINAMAKMWGGRQEIYPKLNKIEINKQYFSTNEDIVVKINKTHGKYGGVEWKLEKIKELTPENAYDAPDYQKIDCFNFQDDILTIKVEETGLYRLYCIIYDGEGRAATGNVVFKIE